MTDSAEQGDAALAALRPHSDAAAAGLRAWDAADRYLLDAVALTHRDRLIAPDARIAIIDDAHGALAVGLATLGVRRASIHQDSVVSQRATRANLADARAEVALDGCPLETVAIGAELVLLRLPRSLQRLDAIAQKMLLNTLMALPGMSA